MRAVLRRDFSFVDGLFAEDIRWRTPGAEGGIQGRAAVHAFFQGLTGLFSGHTIELVDALEDGERLVCFCLHRFTRPDGASGEVESCMDWRCSSGQVVSMLESK